MSVTLGASIAGAIVVLGVMAVVFIVVVAAAILMWPKKKKVGSVGDTMSPVYHHSPVNPRIEEIYFGVDLVADKLREIQVGEYTRELIDKAKASFDKA